MVNLNSSNLSGVAYDAAKGELIVRFKNGSTYSYRNANREVFDAIVTAPSSGKVFNALVKKHPERFPHTRIEG